MYHHRLIEEFKRVEKKCPIQTVDNGEFDACASLLLKHLDMSDEDDPSRTPALVLERCRRGGKTFMLKAVAKTLAQRLLEEDRRTFVVKISLNEVSPFEGESETAVNAIFSRIAHFICAPSEKFNIFRKQYSSFQSVEHWLGDNSVILLIDELNVIPSTCARYNKMCGMLDEFVGQKGGALLYSTHHRIKEDLLRGRVAESKALLSLRSHMWMTIPRIETPDSLVPKGSFQFGFWSAVLRGRVPALVCLPNNEIKNYAESPLSDTTSLFAERQLALGAVLTGNPFGLRPGRDLFRSYCYNFGQDDKSEGETTPNRNKRLIWPPFMVAQEVVLGKDIPPLRNILENPELNEPKAFEALVELSVILRLLSHSDNGHRFVPRHPSVSNDSCFDATEVFHLSPTCGDIDSLLRETERKFMDKRHVLQVVAIPLYDQFPKYDFFLLHRNQFRKRRWTIKVGFQCKMTRQYPDKKHEAEAKKRVTTSVWVEGMPPRSRATENSFGWEMIDMNNLQSILGESIFHALP